MKIIQLTHALVRGRGALSILCIPLLLISLTTGCGEDEEINDDVEVGGEMTTIAGEPAGEEPAGEEPAGEEPAGEEPAGEEPAGEEPAGEEPAGEEPAGEEPAGEEPAGEEPDVFTCDQELIQVQYSTLRPTPTFTYLGVDDRFNFTNYLQTIFTMTPEVGQTFSLDGGTPETCEACIFMALRCEAEGCEDIYFASAGEVTITNAGSSGSDFTFEVSELVFSKRAQNGSLDNSDTTCLSDQEISVYHPTLVGDPVPEEMELQSCETGEMVNVRDFGAAAKGVWYIATAGWCSACRRRLGELFPGLFSTFTPETIRPMIVVTEDDYELPASIEFCREYALRYADDATDFYLDASLETSFTYVWPYFDENGLFGLPWQVVMEGGSGTYLYGDRGPGIGTAQGIVEGLLEQ